MHERDWNTEKVQKLKVMEMELIRVSNDREDLHAQLANAERRARGMVSV